jgi:peroxiredoxin Q/BCP
VTELGELDANVYGVSVDDVSSQAKFVEKEELNFPLLSDPDAGVAKKFGVLSERMPMANRVTFVIDPKGVIRHVETKVQVKTHGRDLVSVLKKLQAE